MEFKRENPPCTFTIPDQITVRQQMRFASTAAMHEKNGADFWERMWIASLDLIQDWQCPLFPDPEKSLDEVYSPQILDLLTWASVRVRKYIDSLDAVPKN